MPTNPTTSSQRETIVVLMLSFLIGAAVFFYLLLIGGAAIFALLFALAAGTVFIGLHYFLWGHLATRDTGGPDEIED